MKETFEIMRENKKERHQKMFIENMNIIDNCGIEFTFRNTVCLFRVNGSPKVDFYPHTGRWKYNNRMYKGGATAFLKWYAKQ